MTSCIQSLEIRVQANDDEPTAVELALAGIYQDGLDINRGSDTARSVASAATAALIRNLEPDLAIAACIGTAQSVVCASTAVLNRTSGPDQALTASTDEPPSCMLQLPAPVTGALAAAAYCAMISLWASHRSVSPLLIGLARYGAYCVLDRSCSPASLAKRLVLHLLY